MLRSFFSTPANTWWNLYVTNAEPEKVLAALAVRDRGGRTVLMQVFAVGEPETAGCKILQILDGYLEQGVSAATIHGLFTMHHDHSVEEFPGFVPAGNLPIHWQAFLQKLQEKMAKPREYSPESERCRCV